MININNTFTLYELSKKKYSENGKLSKKLGIEDMRKIFVFTHNPYIFYLKTMINNEIIIQAISAFEFLKILKNINIGFDDKGKLNNLKNIFEMGYGSNSIKNIFSVKDVTFYLNDFFSEKLFILSCLLSGLL
jgi:hypothetical protein